MKTKNTISSILLFLSIGGIAGCQSVPDKDHLQQCILFANQGDFNNAINECKMSISISPSVDAYTNLGAAYMQLGKYNLAMSALKKGEAINPVHAVNLYNITALHSLMNNLDLGLEYLDKALTHGFKNYDAIRFDADLKNLRAEPEFRTTLEKHKVFIQ